MKDLDGSPRLTPNLDLRGGEPSWRPSSRGGPTSDPLPTQRVDVAIIGSGVMGAMLAQALSASGRTVAILDRRDPAHGSTAASTALVMWASDTPLTELGERIGPDQAGRLWRRVRQAALGLAAEVARLGLRCGWIARPEVYFAGDLLDDAQLRTEGEARKSQGLPSEHLDAEAVAARFGVRPRPALVSADTFETDPVALTLGLLDQARTQGATVTFPADVTTLDHDQGGVALTLADGRSLAADQVVLASGYEVARDRLPEAFTLGSSFAIASPRGMAPLWREDALMWEAADPYLYLRATADGRVLVGGEDEDDPDPKRRDALIAAKAATLQAKAAKLLGLERFEIEYAWAATFGSSPDGLPAIGRARGAERLWLANAFGGNGITFARLAAEIILADLDGTPDPDAAGFDPYRFS